MTERCARCGDEAVRQRYTLTETGLILVWLCADCIAGILADQEQHQCGCVCADCSDAELTND